MLNRLKTRTLLSVIAFFSLLIFSPQPIQAGFWAWITWPLHVLFDSDKNTEQLTRPAPSKNLNRQIAQQEEEKAQLNRSWFVRFLSWGSNLRSFFTSPFLRKPKNNVSTPSPEIGNNSDSTKRPISSNVSTENSDTAAQITSEPRPTNSPNNIIREGGLSGDDIREWMSRIPAEISVDISSQAIPSNLSIERPF